MTRQPLSLTIISFVLLLFLFWCRHYLYPMPAESAHISGAPLAMLIDRALAGYEIVESVTSMIIIFLNAMLLMRLGSDNMIYVVRAYLPVPIYLIISCGMYIASGSVSVFLASLLIIRGLELLVRGFRRSLSFDECFRGAFFIGASALFSSQTIVLFPFIPIILIVFYRTFREHFVAFLGLFMPLVICSYVYWGLGHDFLLVSRMIIGDVITPVHLDLFSDPQYQVRMAFMGLITMLVIFSISTFTFSSRTMRDRARRIFVAFIYLMVACALSFIIPGRSVAGFSLLAIPLSLITPLYFVRYTGRFPALIYFLLLAGSVFLNVVEIIGWP